MIEIHQFEKGCKAISKTLGQRTIVRTIMSKWKCWPSKSSSKAIQKRSDDWSGESQKSQGQHRRNCRPLLRQLRLLFMTALSKRHWPKMASMQYWRGEKCLLTQKNTKSFLDFAERHLDDPQNVLCTDKSRMELFGRQKSHYIRSKPKTLTSTKRTYTYGLVWWRKWADVGRLCCLRPFQ